MTADRPRSTRLLPIPAIRAGVKANIEEAPTILHGATRSVPRSDAACGTYSTQVRGGGVMNTVPLLGLLLAGLVMLAVFFAPGAPPAEAQSSRTTHQVTPDTFSTYFSVDETTGVATLNTAYRSNTELVFATGDYTSGIKIEGAKNVVLKGANPARSANAAIIKPYKPIASSLGATRQSLFEVSGSTGVTVSGFRFDFACVYDATVSSRDSTLTPVGVHYRMHGVMYLDSSGVIADNFIGNYYDMWTPFGAIVKQNYEDLGASFIPPQRGNDHCGGNTRHVQAEYANRATFGAIAALSTSGHVPTVDANGKVTNLRPILIEDNEVVNGVKPAIGVSGWYDFNIRRNTIRDGNNAIDISGGASGRVSSNKILKTNLGVVYAPSWALTSRPTGRKTIEAHLVADLNEITNFSGSAFAIGFNHCADANKDGTVVHANAQVRGNHMSRYVYSNNNPVATAGVEIVVTSHFPHSYGPAEGLAHRRTFGCDPADQHDGERVKAEIVSNTFEQVGPMLDDGGTEHPDERPVAILVVPPDPDFATDGKWQTTYIPGYSAWFEVSAHYNNFVGHETAVRVRKGHIEHGKIDATNNYWGTRSSSPAGLVDNQQSDTASIKYDPWLDVEPAEFRRPTVTGGKVKLEVPTTHPLAGASITLPAEAATLRPALTLVRKSDLPGRAPLPRGFRLGDTIVDVVGIVLGPGQTARLCLPAGKDDTHLARYTSTGWVKLENSVVVTEGGRRLVCADTSSFSLFATIAQTDVTAPSVTYKPPRSLTLGVRIRTIVPRTSDTDIASYRLKEGSKLPPRLRLDETTGKITGRPTRPMPRPTTVTIVVCDKQPTPNCSEVTLRLPAIMEDEEPLPEPTLPPVAEPDLSGISVGGDAPSGGTLLALATAGGALLLIGVTAVTARRRAKPRIHHDALQHEGQRSD